MTGCFFLCLLAGQYWLSLLPVDLPPTADTGTIRTANTTRADDVLAAARAELPPGLVTDVVVAAGDSIEEAVSCLDWLPGEVVLVGSSRLAQIAEVFGVPVATLFDTVPQNLGEAPEQFSATEMRMIRALRRLPSGAASNFVNMIEAFQNESK